jgi:hypothetical protein
VHRDSPADRDRGRELIAQLHDPRRRLVNRYRAMAKSLGFEGHIAMAEAM